MLLSAYEVRALQYRNYKATSNSIYELVEYLGRSMSNKMRFQWAEVPRSHQHSSKSARSLMITFLVAGL